MNRKSLLKVGELLGGLGQRIGLTLYYGNKRLIVSKWVVYLCIKEYTIFWKNRQDDLLYFCDKFPKKM